MRLEDNTSSAPTPSIPTPPPPHPHPLPPPPSPPSLKNGNICTNALLIVSIHEHMTNMAKNDTRVPPLISVECLKTNFQTSLKLVSVNHCFGATYGVKRNLLLQTQVLSVIILTVPTINPFDSQVIVQQMTM